MLMRGGALRFRRGKMNLVQSVLARPEIHVFRQQRGHGVQREILQHAVNQTAEDALGSPSVAG